MARIHLFRILIVSYDGRKPTKRDCGDLPLFELWTETESARRERGRMILFRAYLHAKHAPLAVIFEGYDAYIRTGPGVVKGEG